MTFRKYYHFALLVVLCLVPLAASSQDRPSRPSREPATSGGLLRQGQPTATDSLDAPTTEADRPASPVDPITWKMQGLDLRQKVAQLMIVTLKGSAGAPNAYDVGFMTRYTPGGVILPAVTRPTDALDYVQALRALPVEREKGIPLLFATNLYDLPKRTNLPEDYFKQFPSLLAVTATQDVELARQFGELLASQIQAMGFNMNLGPSLEMAPSLPGVRGSLACIGSDPEFSAQAGSAIVQALLDKAIIAVPMGFPGGGANRRPKEPAVLLTASGQLMNHDLAPYKAVIDLNVPVMHVASTLVPTLDKAGLPACMSAAVITDLLRQKLGYRGVVLAGPMDTTDIAAIEDPTKAAIRSLKAGADMLMWNEAGSRVMKTVDDIVKAVGTGEITEASIDGSLRRVLEMKEHYALAARALPKDAEATKLMKKGAFTELVYAIERRSITLVRNRNNVLPLIKNVSVPVGVTGEVGVEELHAPLEKYLKVVVQQPIRTAKHAGRVLDFEIQRLTTRSKGIRTAVCIFTSTDDMGGKAEIVRQFKALQMNVVVVLVGYPSGIEAFKDADAIVLAYCSPDSCAETMKGVADVLVGQAPMFIRPIPQDLKTKVGKKELYSPLDIVRTPAGILPVTINDEFKAGKFVTYDPKDTLKKAMWDFGDGDRKKDLYVEKAYKKPGRYPVTLTITDKKGKTSSLTFHTVVEDDVAPAATDEQG